MGTPESTRLVARAARATAEGASQLAHVLAKFAPDPKAEQALREASIRAARASFALDDAERASSADIVAEALRCIHEAQAALAIARDSIPALDVGETAR